MKKICLLLTGIFTFLMCLNGCQKIEVNELGPKENSGITMAEAKNLFESHNVQDKKALWELVTEGEKNHTKYITVPVVFSVNLTPFVTGEGINADDIPKKLSLNELTHLFVYKDNLGQVQEEIVTFIPNKKFYSQLNSGRNNSGIKFSGFALVNNWDGSSKNIYNIDNDIIVSTLASTGPKDSNARSAMGDACGSVQWLKCTCNMDPTYHYSCTCTVYGMQDFGCLYYPNPAGGTNTIVSSSGGTSGVFSSSSDGGMVSNNISPSNIFFPGNANAGEPTDPAVADLSSFLRCFSAGSNSNAYSYAITVYVDEPYPSSGKSSTISGDVGHTWVGFEKINNSNNNEAYTRTVGFYPAPGYNRVAAVRGGVNSVVRDNSNHYADVSIRYIVTGSQFESGVYAAIGSASRSYSLENYNCTDFAFSVCRAAQLPIPVASSYIGVDGSIFSLHSPGALGNTLKKLNTNAIKTGVYPSINKGFCN